MSGEKNSMGDKENVRKGEYNVRDKEKAYYVR